MRNQPTNIQFTIKFAKASLMVSIILLSCFSTARKTGERKFQHLQLIVNYSMVELPGPVVKQLPDTIQYYYKDNFVVVGLPIRRSLENSEKVLIQEITHSWFVFKKGAAFGYWYDSLNTSSMGKKLKVDSVLFNRAYATKFDTSPDTLVEEVTNKDMGLVLEKYIPKKFYGELYFDTLYYYYSQRMQHIPYSMSPALDSVKGMKLYKVRLHYNERYSPAHKVSIPKREYLFEIRELPFEDNPKISALVDRVMSIQ